MGRRKKHRRGLKKPQLFWRTFYFYFYPKLMNKIFSKKKKKKKKKPLYYGEWNDELYLDINIYEGVLK